MSEENHGEVGKGKYIYLFITTRNYYKLSDEDLDNLINAALLRLHGDLELGKLPVSNTVAEQESQRGLKEGEPVQTVVSEFERFLTDKSAAVLGLNRDAMRSLIIRVMIELDKKHTMYSLDE